MDGISAMIKSTTRGNEGNFQFFEQTESAFFSTMEIHFPDLELSTGMSLVLCCVSQ